MATGKKSFILYCDLIHEVDHLTDEEKGKLFQHLLEYVNDLNPVMDDRVILGSWKHIQRQLKRDLQKYEGIKEKRSEAGKASAEKRKQEATNSTSVKSVKQTSTNPTVNGNDNVSVTVNDTVSESTNVDINSHSDFDLFFMAYGKKVDLIPCQREWSNIDKAEHQKILKHVPKYVAATPDVKFRKKPINYLKDRTWLDEDLPTQSTKDRNEIPKDFTNVEYP